MIPKDKSLMSGCAASSRLLYFYLLISESPGLGVQACLSNTFRSMHFDLDFVEAAGLSNLWSYGSDCTDIPRRNSQYALKKENQIALGLAII